MTSRKVFTPAERQKIFDKYEGCCAYCGDDFHDIKEMQIDHMYPLHLGGTNDFENLMPACRKCNYYKSTYTLEKFRDQLGLITHRLSDQLIYNLALKYGLVEETNKPVQFYFEWLKEMGCD